MNVGSRSLGIPEEDLGYSSWIGSFDEAPISIVGSVFQELMGNDLGVIGEASHLEVNPAEDEVRFEGFGVPQTSRSVVEDGRGRTEEGELVPDMDVEPAEGMEAQLNGVHEVAKAIFTISKNERDELFALRTKMMELQGYLKSKGLSAVEVEKDIIQSQVKFNGSLQDSNRFVLGRDELGLPVFKDLGGGTQKMTKQVEGDSNKRKLEATISATNDRVKDGKGSTLEKSAPLAHKRDEQGGGSRKDLVGSSSGSKDEKGRLRDEVSKVDYKQRNCGHR